MTKCVRVFIELRIYRIFKANLNLSNIKGEFYVHESS